MNVIYGIVSKELKELLHDYKSYLINLITLLLCGIIFFYLRERGMLSVDISVSAIAAILITMGTLQNVVLIVWNSVGDEIKNGTLELLLSLGTGKMSLVLAKAVIPAMLSIATPVLLTFLFEMLSVISKKMTWSLHVNHQVMFQICFASVLLGLLSISVTFYMTLITQNGKLFGSVITISIYLFLVWLIQPFENACQYTYFLGCIFLLIVVFGALCSKVLDKVCLFSD